MLNKVKRIDPYHIKLNKQTVLNIQKYCIDNKLNTNTMHIYYEMDTVKVAFHKDSAHDMVLELYDHEWVPAQSIYGSH